ncbi:unnamed protein product [Acanthosepion pharaonis]|uniref:Uncharacterized protein n=1 Tax=Acanthosepion pharaonis TaxID=158019 RepID=A0A812AZT4_ACAPH|nr:unnamed protein product [Sepia pharaonis]
MYLSHSLSHTLSLSRFLSLFSSLSYTHTHSLSLSLSLSLAFYSLSLSLSLSLSCASSFLLLFPIVLSLCNNVTLCLYIVFVLALSLSLSFSLILSLSLTPFLSFSLFFLCSHLLYVSLFLPVFFVLSFLLTLIYFSCTSNYLPLYPSPPSLSLLLSLLLSHADTHVSNFSIKRNIKCSCPTHHKQTPTCDSFRNIIRLRQFKLFKSKMDAFKNRRFSPFPPASLSSLPPSLNFHF